MIRKISHPMTDTGPAGLTLALHVAYALHAPVEPTPAPRLAPRAPEVAVPQMMGLRMPAARPHLHKVPLKRLDTLRG
ncbi:hypothetical protein [Streptomyces olivochromogenes]|uniref:hypothetical protein n=1 Tax=Streptomyces olivochromogenes TaxID=1963 RepID=UPI001F30FE36|nr:hypothetical protein [Streptomyces olivochromogenes]MCF3130535.1 hypothetical protein [Streptomyces olivochromogenes]